MNWQQLAQSYIDDGWSILPVPSGRKKATRKWNVEDYLAADIVDGIGGKCGKPSSDRICVDLDCDAAITAADILLPLTRCEGRRSRPASHRWYVCPDAKHRTYDFLKTGDASGRIAEILVNGYAVLPPTIHPCGEAREWSNPSAQFFPIDHETLSQAVTSVAISCLLAQHWPGKGSRHDARLALAGFLRRLDLQDGFRLGIGLALGALVNDDVTDWRAAYASSDRAAKATGGPTLAKHIHRGDEVVARIGDWTRRRNSGRTIRLTSAASITPKPVQWVWEGRVPIGEFGLLAGREGLGKSLVALDLIAQLTRGALPGVHVGTPKTAFICATEDSWEHTLVPRLMACGADLNRVHKIEAELPDGLAVEPTLPTDVAALQQKIIDCADVALVLLDPLMPRLDGGLDTHKDAEVRRALEPLVKLANTTGTVVLGILHQNKRDTTDPLNSLMGSRAFTAVSRFVLFAHEDPSDESVRLLGQIKNNLGAIGPTQTFDIKEVTLPITSSNVSLKIGKVNWTGVDSRSMREILQEAKTMEGPSAGAKATRWLKEFLERRGGYAESDDVRSEGAKAGHNGKALQRAANKLGVTFQSHGMPATKLYVMRGVTPPLSGIVP
ncbi:MAG TPA: AAA family ATPase [Vicinamibacterales bacterium]|nr:AAA family ATPase [Vicinamibacterales bacterium]